MISDASPPKTSSSLDFAAIGLSGLCVVHCLGSALLLAVLSGSVFASSALFDVWHHEAVHLGLLVLATPLAIWTLVRGLGTHGKRHPLILGIIGLKLMAVALLFHDHATLEMLLTLAGVLLLALAHMINLRLCGRIHRA